MASEEKNVNAKGCDRLKSKLLIMFARRILLNAAASSRIKRQVPPREAPRPIDAIL